MPIPRTQIYQKSRSSAAGHVKGGKAGNLVITQEGNYESKAVAQTPGRMNAANKTARNSNDPVDLRNP